MQVLKYFLLVISVTYGTASPAFSQDASYPMPMNFEEAAEAFEDSDTLLETDLPGWWQTVGIYPHPKISKDSTIGVSPPISNPDGSRFFVLSIEDELQESHTPELGWIYIHRYLPRFFHIGSNRQVTLKDEGLYIRRTTLTNTPTEFYLSGPGFNLVTLKPLKKRQTHDYKCTYLTQPTTRLICEIKQRRYHHIAGYILFESIELDTSKSETAEGKTEISESDHFESLIKEARLKGESI